MTRRATTRCVVATAIVVLVAAVLTAHDDRRDLHARRDRLAGDLASTRAEATGVERTLDSLRESIASSARRAEDDRSEAQRIDAAVERIQKLRSELAESAAQLQAASDAASQHRADLEQLQACWRALDGAADSLRAQPADTAAAVQALRTGDRSCTAALELARGTTGAVHAYDFADPSVLVVGAHLYAFGTNGPAGTIQVLHSTDLEHWEIRTGGLRSLPDWAQAGRTWAPSVHQIGSRYVLYYAVQTRSTSKQCISVATSSAPAGPYLDTSTGPLVCQAHLGGSIDPDAYTDGSGFVHLIWKSDSFTTDQPAQIWSQYLGADGTTLLGEPFLMLTADQSWQEDVIENPSMVRASGTWYLVYSGNHWDTDRYATAYATCTTENGPCDSPSDPVLLAGTASTTGTGGAHVFRLGDGTLMVAWAAWDRGYVGLPNIRRLHLGTFRLERGRPTITER